ncbi:MAG TPA: hypothetical protein VGG33_11030 [Polyangia bacterium]
MLGALVTVGCKDDGGTGGADGSGRDALDAPALDAGVADADGAVDRRDGVDADGGRMGGADVARDTPQVACSSLVGQSAFGRVLVGTGDFVLRGPDGQPRGEPRSATMVLHTYFPMGRRPGMAVVFAIPTMYPRPGLSWLPPYTLDATGGLSEVMVTGDFGDRLSGRLLAPDQGFVGTGTRNFAFASDVAMTGAGPIQLCPSGDVPAPKMASRDFALVPTLSLWLAPSTPPDSRTLAALRVMAGGVNVPATVTKEDQSLGGSGIVVKATAAFPPNQAITLDASGVVDVRGRPFTTEPPPAPLVTTAVLTDPTFDTAPVAGALVVASSGWDRGVTHTDGALVVGNPGFASETHALLALGEAPGKTRIRVRVGADCGRPGNSRLQQTTAAVVAADGAVKPVAITCGDPGDVVVDRPGTGPLWLSLVQAGGRPHPQFSPPPPSALVRIEEIAFE